MIYIKHIIVNSSQSFSPLYWKVYCCSICIYPFQTQNPNCLVMVDNCYGEFVESIEPPLVVRADFIYPFLFLMMKGNKMSLLVFRVQI